MATMAFAASLAIILPAFAATSPVRPIERSGGFGIRGGMMPGIAGTVTAVNGTTLTVTSKTRSNATSTSETTGAVYTVNASNAQIVKNGATSTISSIATGDTVMVQGTVSGTSVTATVVRDGITGKRGAADNGVGQGNPKSASSTRSFQGNGEPVVAGSVVSISGTTLTVTNESNVTYAIDTTNAKIIKNGTTTALSSVATGDSIIAQGTVNGTSVTAASIIDQGTENRNGNASSSTSSSGSHLGFFGAIGNFFKHLFGF
jgi:hypothetical protein